MSLRNAGLAASLALAVAAALGGGAACSTPSESIDGNESAQTELDKADWLEKTAKVLRDGDGLGPDDDVAALMAMSKSDVVDLWMKDPRFGDTVLAFNLYFLGRSVDQVKTANPAGGVSYAPIAFEFPQTLAAAKAVIEDGNYYELFNGTPPEFTLLPKLDLPPDNERETVLAMMDEAIASVGAARATACSTFNQAGLRATKRLRVLGSNLWMQIRKTWFAPQPGFPLSVDCEPGSTVTTEALTTSMRAVRTAIEGIWKSAEARQAPKDVVKSVHDFSTISLDSQGLPPLVKPLGQTFFTTLPASSTNFHRKRAAYMLKTYFCDDLTPLELPATEGDGGSDVHASNPNCQSCHYRLDPIGALFRDIGGAGVDFTGKDAIVFDDNIMFSGAAHDQYLGQWRNADGSYRAGYWIIGNDGRPKRDPAWTDADGDKLPGFWNFVRRSKVVKSCLVRRLSEYVLGPKQVYDREWLAQISSSLKDGPNSGAAFKQVFKSLVLSKTFSVHNPEQGTCYDVPADAPAERAPCAIAHVVSSQCAGCHDSTAGFGHLDFTKWVDVGGGVYSWPHLGEDGAQLPRAESLERIKDRITNPNLTLRMPKARAMPAEDFTTLRDWLTTNLENP
jgi:hypothetical protein